MVKNTNPTKNFAKESICSKGSPSVGLPTGLEKETGVTVFRY